MTGVRRRAAAAVAAVVAAVPAGCGLLGEDQPGAGSATTQPDATTTTTPREPASSPRERLLASQDGGFDASEIYRESSAGVVTVITRFDSGLNPLDPEGGGGGGLGSGFVVDGDGHVATNAHVVLAEGSGRRANEVFVEFADRSRTPAEIVGEDPNSDVALLKLDPDGMSLRPLPLGTSEGLTVGEPVAAIGSPLGERQTLTVGVISALDRDIQSLTDFRIGNAIQTDAAINQGNSGGPLLNADGEVIGINQQIKSTTGGSVGLGFAVPADTVKRSIEQLRESGKVAYPYIGVSTMPLYPQLADHLGLDVESGALVTAVVPGGPADRAGVRPGRALTEFQGDPEIPRGGDVILSVDRRPLTATSDLADLIAAKRPGDEVRLELLRDDDRRTVAVRLGERPSRATPG